MSRALVAGWAFTIHGVPYGPTWWHPINGCTRGGQTIAYADALGCEKCGAHFGVWTRRRRAFRGLWSDAS